MANRVFSIRLVQWLGWVFETQERKKERIVLLSLDPLDLSVFTYTSFSPMISFHHRNQFCCGTKKIETSTTNFHSPTFTHHFDLHAFPYMHKHPLKSTLFSPTHPPISPSFFTYLFPPSFFHPFCFHPHRFLSPAVPQKSIFTHDSLRSCFTHLLISPTCRFHLLALD